MQLGREDQTVLAMVLTHNSPVNLLRTLRAVGDQTRKPDEVLIVDNASDPPASESLAGWTPPAGMPFRILREEQNSGPGGGWATALGVFRSSKHRLGWILDDDIVAPPQGLELLLDEGGVSDRTFIIPSVRQPNGATTNYPAWHGVLLARKVVESVGLPRADFFWWAEDTEYLMWRIPRAGYPLRYSNRVLVEHKKGRGESGSPPWKYYYEARNSLYYHLYLRRGRGRWPRKMAMLTLRAVIREHDRRVLRLLMIARGTWDGVTDRLGKRVDPSRYN